MLELKAGIMCWSNKVKKPHCFGHKNIFCGYNVLCHVYMACPSWTTEKASRTEEESDAFLKGNNAEGWENISLLGNIHNLINLLLFFLLPQFSAMYTSGKLSGNIAFQVGQNLTRVLLLCPFTLSPGNQEWYLPCVLKAWGRRIAVVS